MTDGPPDHPLDAPVLTSLTGTHAGLAERRGRALRYLPDVAPWASIPEHGWGDLAALTGPGGVAALVAAQPRTPPAGWEVELRIPGVQLDGSAVAAVPDSEAVLLGDADVPEMLDLVARTQPGPFEPRTHRLGTYLGIRSGDALVAMAGERMRPPGWSEISAVCTDPAFRGRGLAERLVRAVAATVRERGDVPFLHASAANTGALALYARMGFTLRRTVEFAAFRAPGE